MSVGRDLVLLVEDDPDAQAILAACCARLGLDAITCADLPAARTHLAQQPVSVAVVDHHVGGKGLGLDLLIELQERNSESVRILCSASAEPELLVAAINRGHVDAFLAKPLRAEACLGAIGKGIELLRLRRANRALVDRLEQQNSELAAAVGDRTRHLEDLTRRLQDKHHELVRLETQGAIGHLVRGLAHELNNPLAAILGYAQRLGRAHDDPETTRKVEIIVAEVDRCRGLVDRLRRLAAPLEEDIIPTEAGDAALHVWARLREQHGSMPDISIEPDLFPVQAAPRSLERVFEQILANAAQAGATSVRLGGRVQNDRVHLFCDNDGATPDDTEITNATRPFFTTRSTTGGRGLGLAIAAGLLREQDGTIGLDRRPDGPGARISISLPLAASTGRYHRLQRIEAKPQVLVVDDEPLVAELLADCLSEIGCDVRTVDTITRARHLIANQPLRAIIVDMHLPDGNGLDLLTETIATHPHLRGHVALITGDAVDAQGLADADLPVLAKPFRLESMTEFVARLL